MRYGASLPWLGPAATPRNVVATAEAMERLGYAHAYIGGHYVYPSVPARGYRYSLDGVLGIDLAHANLDIFTTLAFVAARTTTLRLKTHVFVLPWQSPLITAKQVATLDLLSGGRVELGIGAGWMREELEALGVPFEARGALTDEYIDVMRALWTQPETTFEGAHVRLDGIHAEPKPVQSPLPIWATGSNARTIRRIARRCGGWLIPGDVPVLSDKHRVLRELLVAELARAGRHADADAFPTAASLNVHFDDPTGSRSTYPTTFADRDAVLALLDSWAAGGITVVDVRLMSAPDAPGEVLIERLEWFAEAIFPARREQAAQR